jgi:hypothetical protein
LFVCMSLSYSIYLCKPISNFYKKVFNLYCILTGCHFVRAIYLPPSCVRQKHSSKTVASFQHLDEGAVGKGANRISVEIRVLTHDRPTLYLVLSELR